MPGRVFNAQSFGQSDSHKTVSSDVGAGLRWQELLPPDREHARLLIRGGIGQCVQIPDWSVFVARYDAACQALVARSGHHTIAGTRPPPPRRTSVWRRIRAALR